MITTTTTPSNCCLTFLSISFSTLMRGPVKDFEGFFMMKALDQTPPNAWRGTAYQLRLKWVSMKNLLFDFKISLWLTTCYQ